MFDRKEIPQRNLKGNCYKAAVDNMIRNQKLTLCHGVVKGQEALEGYEYPHAWNEINDTVCDTSDGRFLIIDKKSYYEIGCIDESKVVRYTFKEVYDNITKHKTYGPWLDEFDFDYRKVD